MKHKMFTGHTKSTMTPPSNDYLRMDRTKDEEESMPPGDFIMEDEMLLEGVGRVTVVLSSDCITWHRSNAACNADRSQRRSGCFSFASAGAADESGIFHCYEKGGATAADSSVPLCEVYGVEMLAPGPPAPAAAAAAAAAAACFDSFAGAAGPALQGWGVGFGLAQEVQHRLAVHTFRRAGGGSGAWAPVARVLSHADPRVCRAWLSAVQALLRADAARPRKLLVLVNPYGGKRQGAATWKEVAPIFDRAGVHTEVVTTQRAGHAFEVANQASDAELAAWDGIVVVGGDGIFNEVLNGLALKRHLAPPIPTPKKEPAPLPPAPAFTSTARTPSTRGTPGGALSEIELQGGRQAGHNLNAAQLQPLIPSLSSVYPSPSPSSPSSPSSSSSGSSSSSSASSPAKKSTSEARAGYRRPRAPQAEQEGSKKEEEEEEEEEEEILGQRQKLRVPTSAQPSVVVTAAAALPPPTPPLLTAIGSGGRAAATATSQPLAGVTGTCQTDSTDDTCQPREGLPGTSRDEGAGAGAGAGASERRAPGTPPLAPPPPGGPGLPASQGLCVGNRRIRIGIIPAGSTDAIVISVTGTRDAATSALHIVLGDRMPLDVVRISSWQSSSEPPPSSDATATAGGRQGRPSESSSGKKKARHGHGGAADVSDSHATPRVRYAASFAGYGFYGEVARESEQYRWMGPARYDVAGFFTFLRHKMYEAEVSYLEMPAQSTPLSPEACVPVAGWPGTKEAAGLILCVLVQFGLLLLPHSSSKVLLEGLPKRGAHAICRVNCGVCADGIDLSHLATPPSDEQAPLGIHAGVREGGSGPRWRTVRAKFLSIGAAVMSCRNDKAPDGVAAHAHLADGHLHLILIRECSHVEYLRCEGACVRACASFPPCCSMNGGERWGGRQLLRLTRKGADPSDFSFVEYHKASKQTLPAVLQGVPSVWDGQTPAFTFVSHGARESVWNVDGELFPARELSAQVFRGLIDVFARGPEN
eukprot:jgi/Mesen1/5732/ME000029S05043